MPGDQELADRIRECIDELREAVSQAAGADLLVTIKMLGGSFNPAQFDHAIETATVSVARVL